MALGRRQRGLAVEILESRRLLSGSSPAVVGYLPDWEAPNLSTIDLGALTRINYYSIVANADGSLPTTSENGSSLSNLRAVVAAAHAASPRIAVSITIDPSTPFQAIAQSAVATANFTNNLIALCATYNLDGIDLDYEPGAISNALTTTYGNMIAAIHTQTAAHGLTLSAAVQSFQMTIPAADIADVNYFYLMDYDLDPNSSAPYSQSIAVLTASSSYGIPKSQLLMGLPFYGRSGASWSASAAIPYDTLVSSYYVANGSYPDPSLDSFTIAGTTWGFNGVDTIAEKTQFALQNGYGGVMIWGLGDDYVPNESPSPEPLLAAIKSVVTAWQAPPAAVTGVSSTTAAGTYGTGATISITVTFSEAVTVSGTPQLALNSGSGAAAVYAGGSGTSTLTFNYTVLSGQSSADLDYSSTAGLTLNGGAIVNAADNSALLTLPTPGADPLALQALAIVNQTLLTEETVDNTSPGFWSNGAWAIKNTGLGGSSLVSNSPNGSQQSMAAWWFTCQPGTYDIQVTWQPGSNLSQQVPFDVYDGADWIKQTTVNQQLSPAGATGQGMSWQSLGICTITSNSLHVSTWNSPTDGAVCADGVRIVPASMEKVMPSITWVSSILAGTFGTGATIPITVTFSEAVTVSGTPQLALNAGSGATAIYAGGSGTSTLTFNYTVVSGQNSTDLDYSSTAGLALNGGSVVDASGNAALLVLPTTGSDGLATRNIRISTQPPVITGVSSAKAAGLYGTGTIIPITVNFNEAVTVTGTPQLALNAGNGATAVYAGGSGTYTLTFNYTVLSGQNISGLDYSSTKALSLNGGAIVDAAGNSASLVLPAIGSDGLAIRRITISGVKPAPVPVQPVRIRL